MLFNCAILDALGAALVPNPAINEPLGDTKLSRLAIEMEASALGRPLDLPFVKAEIAPSIAFLNQ